MWPKRLLLALLARQCSAEPRMEDPGKEELGLVNRERVKANQAHIETQEFSGHFPGSLGHRWLISKAGQECVPLFLPLGNLMAESTVIKVATVGVLSRLLRCVGGGDMSACRQDMYACRQEMCALV